MSEVISGLPDVVTNVSEVSPLEANVDFLPAETTAVRFRKKPLNAADALRGGFVLTTIPGIVFTSDVLVVLEKLGIGNGPEIHSIISGGIATGMAFGGFFALRQLLRR